MYLPAHFAETRPEVLHALVRAHPLGGIVRAGPAGLAADHVPLLLEAGGAAVRLLGHVARANPLWHEADGAEVLVVFCGEEHYITPAWYPAKHEHGRVVPTWNYAVVHAHGRLAARDDAVWLRALVSRLTDRHESARAEPWRVSDAPEGWVAGQLRAIVGIEIEVTRLEGKWKASQNRSRRDREGVIEGLGAEPGGAAMAALLRDALSRAS